MSLSFSPGSDKSSYSHRFLRSHYCKQAVIAVKESEPKGLVGEFQMSRYFCTAPKVQLRSFSSFSHLCGCNNSLHIVTADRSWGLGRAATGGNWSTESKI